MGSHWGTHGGQEVALVRVRLGEEWVELTWAEWEARVRAGRVPEDALVRIEAVTGNEAVPARDLETYQSLRNDAALAYQDRFAGGPPPLLTALLVGVQIRIWWLAQVPQWREEIEPRSVNWSVPLLEDGEVWRMATAGLLHVDALHIFTNIVWLAYTGWNLERALGPRNVALLFGASVLGGSTLSAIFTPETPSLGASGGVFGLVAASVVFGLVRPELLPARGRRLFGVALLPYLVLLFYFGFVNEGVDNWAHLGGLLTGAALAPLVDPETLQRRVGWNRNVAIAVLAACGLLLAVPAGLGAYLVPTEDSEVHRIRQLNKRSGVAPIAPDDRYRSLTFDVPVAWGATADATGRSGVASPLGAGQIRVWSVLERTSERLQRVEALADAWTSALSQGWPDAKLEPARSTELAGRPALEISAVIDADGVPRRVVWRGAVQGTFSLEEMWQVDLARERRLGPLRDRLRASVVWGDSAALHAAKAELAERPASVKARSALARALVAWGEVDEAVALVDELVQERPDDSTRWITALQVVRTGLSDVAEPEAWFSRALAASSSSDIVEHVALGLVELQRGEAARGLLELAWRRAPGDRVLRRARRAQDLPVELDAQGRPWSVSHDPVTGDARSPLPPPDELSLEAASAEGRRLAAERAELTRRAVDALEQGSPSLLRSLVLLRMGYLPPVSDDLRGAVRDEAVRAIEGRVPAWMPAKVAEAATEHQTVVEQLSTASY